MTRLGSLRHRAIDSFGRPNAEIDVGPFSQSAKQH
jgi:hypothetical protein